MGSMAVSPASGGREILTANLTYYVRTDGADTNNGLANTAGGAFLTLTKVAAVLATLDFGGYTVTVQLADGTYTAGLTIPALVGCGAPTNLIIQGNNATPANVVISTTSASCFVGLHPSAQASVRDLRMQTTTTGSCIIPQNGSKIEFQNVDFGVCAQNHIRPARRGVATASGNYTISGGAQNHMAALIADIEVAGRTVTLTGTPAFSVAFCAADQASFIRAPSNTYSGSATGTRYAGNSGSGIYVAGGGASYFPGDSAGSVDAATMSWYA